MDILQPLNNDILKNMGDIVLKECTLNANELRHFFEHGTQIRHNTIIRQQHYGHMKKKTAEST